MGYKGSGRLELVRDYKRRLLVVTVHRAYTVDTREFGWDEVDEALAWAKELFEEVSM
jgi:hypothetical protein